MRTRSFWDRIAWAWATGLGLGYLKPGPGTWASAVACVAAWWLRPYGLMFWAALVILLVSGCWAADRAERAAGEKDPQVVVVDEMGGMFVVFGVLPVGRPVWWVGLMGLVLFRVFDIGKPWLVRRVQGLRGGWGIVADDVLAGLLAGAVTRTVCVLAGRRCWLNI